ncbi:aminotransferase class I/II-fold pyridoxal phosphate-dependent enzyme [Streptomyces sp. AV19]|uniref:aminotransferase class I/II-fold pyridoxal phosphate-dependent enzyme n=1 Tax=Streptomyces sp. AV19 TaxID=2793068 RepID=UPI0018FEDB91|nr:aminotransferase class I/II-fold pyridoxal phosphate-dependent enzyme [Streptomyces sp. AV19]MBH1938249.1 aminotransferase class I/II-fold pyridoxal phosphate-dependent enzyme [Streptomyces sp. AV19]MDG4534879.1 aminotransferase class I/II-fold pyridoxal phosphate-dependent enzyme [Streptomyces sp. AV19]
MRQRSTPPPGVPASEGGTAFPGPEPSLPVLPELAERFAAAAGRAAPEPLGGSRELRTAACGHWARRGLAADPADVVAAPGAQPLLLALFASAGGEVLLTRPCAAWYAPLARLAGRLAYHVPVPAECGGVPDPFALLETVARIRAEGGRPRFLVLSVADDTTGTVAPPETLHEVCEAAAAEELTVISDETWRDGRHDPHATVFVGPAEMYPDRVVVLTDLAGGPVPAAWPAAVALFPRTAPGPVLRTRALSVLAALRAELPPPVAAAALWALGEPAPVRARAAAAARLYASLTGAVHERITAEGVLARPPQTGPHLYADLGELRAPLARRAVTDSVELEDRLTAALGRPVPGGHRFGDEPDALRVRLSALPLLGNDGDTGDDLRRRALDDPDPPALPDVARALDALGAAFAELAGG